MFVLISMFPVISMFRCKSQLEEQNFGLAPRLEKSSMLSIATGGRVVEAPASVRKGCGFDSRENGPPTLDERPAPKRPSASATRSNKIGALFQEALISRPQLCATWN